MRTALPLLLLLSVAPAWAHAPQFTLDEIEWMDRQRAVDGTKCCNDQDVLVGMYVEWRMKGGRYQVKVSGSWRDIPPGRILNHRREDPSPFPGEAILFVSPNPNHPDGFSIWCFSPPPLM